MSGVKGDGSIRKAWRTPPVTPQESNINNEDDPSSSRSKGRSSSSSKSNTGDISTTSHHKRQSNTSRSNALLSNINKRQQQLYPSNNNGDSQDSSSNNSNQRDVGVITSYTTKSQQSLSSGTIVTKLISAEEQHSKFAPSHSSISSSSTGRTKSAGLRLTGDPETDDDIMAFMRARQQLANKSKFCFLMCFASFLLDLHGLVGNF